AFAYVGVPVFQMASATDAPAGELEHESPTFQRGTALIAPIPDHGPTVRSAKPASWNSGRFLTGFTSEPAAGTACGSPARARETVPARTSANTAVATPRRLIVRVPFAGNGRSHQGFRPSTPPGSIGR